MSEEKLTPKESNDKTLDGFIVVKELIGETISLELSGEVKAQIVSVSGPTVKIVIEDASIHQLRVKKYPNQPRKVTVCIATL